MHASIVWVEYCLQSKSCADRWREKHTEQPWNLKWTKINSGCYLQPPGDGLKLEKADLIFGEMFEEEVKYTCKHNDQVNTILSKHLVIYEFILTLGSLL